MDNTSYQPTTACFERSNGKPLMFITPITLQAEACCDYLSNYASSVTFAQSLGLDCSRKLNCVGKESGKGLDHSYITMNWVPEILLVIHVIHRELLFQLGGGVRSKETVTFDMSELTYKTSMNLKLSAFL
ncbi:hypothetical protein PHMEG_00011460 [Phytophthora megakarya]|uniref:Uncharacterized protein n=1 Tax=Phytophthora megakarya TaxID=4795 RepID=A0A225WD89_9STRA|nr:hypothetical protein PHMEG_00011460 [Phytophthora megakarya]